MSIIEEYKGWSIYTNRVGIEFQVVAERDNTQLQFENGVGGDISSVLQQLKARLDSL